MDVSKFESIVKFAIEKEEEAINAYRGMMEKTNLSGMQELLAELQEEEKNHKKLLEDLTKEKLEAIEFKQVEDLKISDYIVEEAEDDIVNFQDLLIYAAKKEQKAVELYTHLAEMSDSAELKKLFEFLVEQEKKHKLKLEIEYEKHVLEEA